MDDLVDFSDFLPTFIDLAGAQLTSDRTIDGTSFADRLRGQGASPRTWAYSESAVLPKPGGVEPDGEHSGLRWVRNVHWKLYSDGRLYAASANGQVKQFAIVGEEATFDLNRIGTVRTYEGHADHLFAVDAKNNLVAAAGYNGEVVIWDVDSGEIASRFVAKP